MFCGQGNNLGVVTFQVLTASSMKFRVFWDVAPCSQVEVDRRLRVAYCLHRPDDGSGTHLYIPEDSKLHFEGWSSLLCITSIGLVNINLDSLP
jgi:hypothetical protein